MKVRFHPAGTEVDVDVGTTLFEAALSAGLPVGSSCGADGTCGRCGLRVVSGSLPAPSDREEMVLADNRLEAGIRLSCMVAVTTEVEVTADYW